MQMKVSDCCRAIIMEAFETPICSDCLEHCDVVEEDE